MSPPAWGVGSPGREVRAAVATIASRTVRVTAGGCASVLCCPSGHTGPTRASHRPPRPRALQPPEAPAEGAWLCFSGFPLTWGHNRSLGSEELWPLGQSRPLPQRPLGPPVARHPQASDLSGRDSRGLAKRGLPHVVLMAQRCPRLLSRPLCQAGAPRVPLALGASPRWLPSACSALRSQPALASTQAGSIQMVGAAFASTGLWEGPSCGWGVLPGLGAAVETLVLSLPPTPEGWEPGPGTSVLRRARPCGWSPDRSLCGAVSG